MRYIFIFMVTCIYKRAKVVLVVGCVLVRSECKLRISVLEGGQVVLVSHICVFGFGWM